MADFSKSLICGVGVGLICATACTSNLPSGGSGTFAGVQVNMLVGSALKDFCTEASSRFNQQKNKLDSGKEIQLTCIAKGSGDVVTEVATLAERLKNGSIKADAPEFPTLISLDGEVSHGQLIAKLDRLFPGQKYIPDITESPLLASSPMVFMAQADLAKGLRKPTDLNKLLATAKNHQEIDAASPPLKVHYVHTAPTRSNSGLQTLVAQFASVSGKPAERLTLADVTQYQGQVQQIQRKVTRYGVSTNALAKAMVQNGQFWATVGSVYESSVIEANSNLQPGQPRYEAIYPKATFTSAMRAILANAPWVSAEEKAAAEKVITFLRSPDVQQTATSLGLRPGVPGIPLGPKFTAEYGVDANAQYDSLRSPKPEVVDAMLKAWEEVAKKPSKVVLVIDTSGSMGGERITAMQQTLQTYINGLGKNDQVAMFDFNSVINQPILIDGSAAGKAQGIQFVGNLKARGQTKLYDAVLFARNYLKQNLRKDAINAVLILTDGEDSGSTIKLPQLGEELKKSGFTSDDRISFFTVGYGNEGEFNPQALQQIAALNGGYYSKGDPATIGQLMANLQVEF